MSLTRSSGPEQRWQEVLRRVAIALKGRGVSVCEADARGRVRLLAASSAAAVDPVAADEVEATLRELGEVRGAGQTPRLWVAGRLKPHHWCVTPVRSALPQPPPAGVERRSPERLTLELGGVCIGLIEAPGREATASGAAGPQALLASIAEQVPALLWTTDAALRVTSRSGSGPKSLELLPSRVVGASLLEQYDRGELPAESVDVHRQALAGKSVSYQMRLADRYYDARVKPLRNDAGAIVGVVGLAVDVSDRERALVQARRSQRELEDFVEHTPVGMRWTGPDGRRDHHQLEPGRDPPVRVRRRGGDREADHPARSPRPRRPGPRHPRARAARRARRDDPGAQGRHARRGRARRLADPRPARPGHRRHVDCPRYHGAQACRATVAARGAARRADRSAEPCVPGRARDASPGARATGSGLPVRGPVHRFRQVQGGQR